MQTCWKWAELQEGRTKEEQGARRGGELARITEFAELTVRPFSLDGSLTAPVGSIAVVGGGYR